MDQHQGPHPLIAAIQDATEDIRNYRYYLVEPDERIVLLVALQDLIREGSYHLDANDVTVQHMIDTANDPLNIALSRGPVPVELAICGGIEKRVIEMRREQERKAGARNTND